VRPWASDSENASNSFLACGSNASKSGISASIGGREWCLPAEVLNYFTVFEPNAGLLGRIDDEQLLKKIVSVYGQSKGLVDAMNFNFWRFEYANSIALQEGAESTKIALLDNELTDLASGLQNGMNILLPEVTELLEKISKYLATNDKKSG
jgi:hypothetical protein